jgi:hypothetical protein
MEKKSSDRMSLQVRDFSCLLVSPLDYGIIQPLESLGLE